jgi:SNF2 family DNA or RNA helicase
MIDLFDFQLTDVNKLESQSAVLIGNEMGTGKTYEAIERDLRIRSKVQGPTLVIAPLTPLESTWLEHYNELTNLTCVLIDPKNRAKSWEEFTGPWHPDVFLVHWDALRLMPEIARHSWAHIIADEVHRAKDRKSQQTRALKAIQNTIYKTGMSGTPVVNRPDELWSTLNWLYPKKYGSYWKFCGKYVEYEIIYAKGRTFKKVKGPQNEDQLLKEIEPFYVRHLKKNVLKDLPPKYYTRIKVDLTAQQRRVYNTMRDDMIAWIGSQEDDILPAPVVIAQLIRLQQFAVAYAELSEGRVKLSEPSSKLDAVMEIIDETDQQVVVFSQFKQAISLLGDRLSGKSVPYVALTGDTPQAGRAELVARFQRGDARVFAGTIGAGGVGITLHAASTVIFIDRHWSPALNIQAEDRLHRIGQKNAVQVIDISAKNTVDANRAVTLATKAEWIRRILGDNPS